MSFKITPRWERTPRSRFTPVSEFFVVTFCAAVFVQAVVGLYLFAGGLSPTRAQVSLAFLSSALAFVLGTMVSIFTVLLKETSPVNPRHEHPMATRHVTNCSWFERSEQVVGPDHALDGDRTAVVFPRGDTLYDARVRLRADDGIPRGRLSVSSVVTVFLFSTANLLLTPACVMSLMAQTEAYVFFEGLILSLTLCGAINYIWYVWANKVGGVGWRTLCSAVLLLTVALASLSMYVAVECS